MMQPMRTALLLLAPLLLATTSVAQAPGLSESDRRQGAAANPQLVAQFGGAYNGPQAAYVRRIGQRIAMQSGLASKPDDYTVTLLNSNVNNAFAIPGGYVYVTRQLVALMNDEAELAFVLGHEVAHVAARHADKRATRSGIAGLGAAILGAVTGSSVLGNLAGTGAELYSLNYSRDQETEADRLGVRYLTRAGYDPAAGADILASLGAQTSLEGKLSGQGGREPAPWLSTHPANAGRVAQVRREAAAVTAATSRATNRDAFLDAIDGMPYDDDPVQGIVDGSRFRHAGLNIAFDAPAGFALQNTPTAVNGTKQGAGRFAFGGGQVRGAALNSYTAKLWEGLGVRPPELRPRRINGIDALISQTRVQRSNGTIDASVVVYQWAPDTFYHIVMLAPAGGLPNFGPLVESVRRLAPGEVAATRGRHVKVVRVAPGDTVASLAARMAYNDEKVARFTILNGISATTPLTPGSRVKLIVAG
jgi:predicted Zn-dependent protease